MKKLKLSKYIAVTVLLLAFTGCNDILEKVEPSTSVSGEVALTSPDAVRAIRASMYSKIRASFDHTTEYMVGPGAFADETRNRPGSTRFSNLNQAFGTSGLAHLGNWGESYDIIQDANLLIGAIEPGVLPDADLNRFRGEAYAIRAYVMHHLARTYGYEPGRTGQGPEADWNLSVIIRTEPTLDLSDADKRPRSTVSDVYAQMLADLQQAKTLLAGVNANNTFVTEAFVDAVTARVNLYAGNWAAASTAAQAAITNSGRPLVNTADGVAGMFYENDGNHPEAILKLIVDPNTEPIGGSNVNNGLAAYTSDQWVAQIPTQFVIDKYEAGDYRLAGWYRDCLTNQTTGAAANGCADINDLAAAVTKWNGRKGNLADDIPLIRVAEMYLIWAEAAAKAANNPASGQAPLAALRTARNAGAVPASALANMTAFEDFILDERIRELIVEGHRFWDLKRLGRDVRNPDDTIKMFANAYRILAPIGAALINVNELLVENPGY
ncbi:MAG: RagB/SusD family nutrient uptake outer membrane protein [Cyclonatronaceae bacterium]